MTHRLDTPQRVSNLGDGSACVRHHLERSTLDDVGDRVTVMLSVIQGDERYFVPTVGEAPDQPRHHAFRSPAVE